MDGMELYNRRAPWGHNKQLAQESFEHFNKEVHMRPTAVKGA